MSKWLELAKQTYNEWSDDDCMRLAAALSYYTFTSIIPLLLVIAAIATFFLNFTETGQDYRSQIIDYIGNAVGGDVGAQLSEQLSQAAEQREAEATGSIISTIIGFVTLFLGASVIFGQLYDALNIIWDVPDEKRPQGVWAVLRSKLTAFALVIGAAIILLASTLLSTLLQTILNYFQLTPPWLYGLINIILQFCILSFVFAMLYKYLPDIDVKWSDVLVGGAATAALWLLGQYLLTLYFTYGGGFSSYGIIGGVLAFLVYVYYASVIIFFGAEFAQVYARRYGSLATESETGQRGITPEAALMINTTMAGVEREIVQRDQELSTVKNKQYAAAATGSLIGLVVGALIGGIGLVVGVARRVSRLRART